MKSWLFPAVLCCAALGCDARATPEVTTAIAPSSSHAFESCAASLDCAEGLRCFEQTCQPAARSLLGDFYAEVGAQAVAAGEVESAIAAYAEALVKYETDGIALPADVDCGYGAALLKDSGKPERAELSARVLHRCALATPAGAPLHAQALASLARLMPAGLDPIQLQRQEPADLYLTRAVAPPKSDLPSLDEVKIYVSATPLPTEKSYPNLAVRLNENDLRKPLLDCWSAWSKATQKPELVVAIGFRSKVVRVYDDEPARVSVTLDEVAPIATPQGLATTCVRTVLATGLTKNPGVRDAFSTTLEVRIK